MAKKKTGRGPGNSAKAPNQARRYEETLYFHEAALSGYSNAQVADLASTRFGRKFSAQTVANRLAKYRDERIVESVDRLRGVTLDRYDRYLVALDRTILAPPGEAYDEDGSTVLVDLDDARMKAIDRALRIEAQRSKLLGLDMPAQAEVTVTNLNPVDLSIEALAAELANDE